MVLVSKASDGVRANHRSVASISAISTNFTRGQPISAPHLSASASVVCHCFHINGAAPRGAPMMSNTDAPVRLATRCPASFFPGWPYAESLQAPMHDLYVPSDTTSGFEDDGGD
jgi:hypothetical protein